MKVLQLIIGLFLGGVGLLIASITLIGILDPVGSKMSDDSNPFGDPTISIFGVVVSSIISIGCLVVSRFLIKSIDKKQ